MHAELEDKRISCNVMHMFDMGDIFIVITISYGHLLLLTVIASSDWSLIYI